MMKHTGIKRLFKHLFSTPWHTRRHFPAASLHKIEQAISLSERSHSGQIRFVVEGELHPVHIVQGTTPRERALKLFSDLGIWDTAQNNGVLIYLLLADRDVEIVADRGIHAKVGEEHWQNICHQMEISFRQGAFEAGVLLGIEQTGALLTQHFPVTTNQLNDRANELPDSPVVL